MAGKKKLFTPWSSLDNMLGKLPAWWPAEEQQRIAAYEKYDQMYWNDPTQYAIRVLENEQPIYVPNARVIVNTTAQYLMKGLELVATSSDAAVPATSEDAERDREASDKSPAQRMLDDFLRRERFYSKFHINKQAGITRGDSAFHITADPNKPEGERISIDTLHPGMVWRVPDEDDPEKTVRIHIVQQWEDSSKPDDPEVYIRKLTYEKVLVGTTRRISREEAIYKLSGEKGMWFGPTPEKVKTLLAPELLPEQITHFPVYWVPNLEWESQDYGSSELRGLEFLEWAVSQGTTDTQMALALEGLGVYATDGGRPVDDRGRETDWEIIPGGVMEVPSGSYFRRVEGVGSITPMMDQLKYLEQKMYAATGMTDVALGQVDVQVAQSGVALAIKFMPTLARIEPRDTAQTEILYQMWHDMRFWFEVYDRRFQIPEVEVGISASKLPPNRVELLNELNNMVDRKIISRAFYRREAIKLGYKIPADEDETIRKEAEMQAKIAAASAPAGLAPNAERAVEGKQVITNANGGNNSEVDNSPNRSNNRNRPNESSGTEAGSSSQ